MPERSNTLYWIALVAILFPILAILGLYMRVTQAGHLQQAQAWFYPMMTLHGVGMVGVWFVGAMAAASRVLGRYTEPHQGISRFAFWGSVVGVALLLGAVFAGRFGAGWYFLYPLPMRGSWPAWSAVMFLASLTVLGAVWLVWTLNLLLAIAHKFPLSQAAGWHYIAGRTEPAVPAAITVLTITLVAVVACLLAGVAVLLLYYVELVAGLPNDALLMKNLTFLFGHLLVNLSMYLGIGCVYDILPEYAGRPWKNNRIVAISWNSVFAIVMLAYFHHLYMDFVQLETLQIIGQIASYGSAIPASVVTVFGALALLYRAPVRWNLTSSFFFLGLMGWGIGGIGAFIDSTISVNLKFHNTLWVPAHFHTYMIEGLVLMVLGSFHHYCRQMSGLTENLRLQKMVVALFTVGGYGLLAMFYLAGAESVPRRYAIYPVEVSQGTAYAAMAVGFVVIFLVGLVLYTMETGRHWMGALRGGTAAPTETV